jgi:membrane protein implicated in regulation of membrane protease activity
MVSLFPDLFDWSFYVPFFFRVFLSIYIIGVGYSFFKKSTASTEKSEDTLSWGILGGLLILLASCLLIGAVVQVAGAVVFAVSLLAIYAKKYNLKEIDETTTFYLLFALVGISLVFLGPGPFAFDLPL